MAAQVVFLLFLLRFTVFSTLAESYQAAHDISVTDIKNLVARVTDLEKGLQEERNRRMDLEREVASMTKQNEDTINSLKLDFNNRITILEKRIGDNEAVYTEDKITRPAIVKPLSKRKDNSLCENNQFKALREMFFPKLCRYFNRRSNGYERNEVQRYGRLLSVPASPNIIAFSAYMSATLPANLATGLHVLVFDVVILNLGNAYHPTTGVYMVPETGVYIFTWSFRSNGISYHTMELVKNSEVILDLYLRTASNADQVTGITPVYATKGDDVFIRTQKSASSGQILSDSSGKSYFAGWKLQ